MVKSSKKPRSVTGTVEKTKLRKAIKKQGNGVKDPGTGIKKSGKVTKVKKTKSNLITKLLPNPSVKEEVAEVSVIENIETKSKKKSKYVMPSKSVTDDLVNSSINALRQLAAHYKKKNALFDDESMIFAEIKCIKIQSANGNIKFVLPHSTAASTGEICLITPDIKKGRKIDHEPTIDQWEEILRKAGVSNVKTILPVRQLKVEYDQFELKRRLLTQHDFVMVDTRVLSHVSHLLGKMFFKKHNMLIPVRINEKKDIKHDIDVGLRTVMLRLSQGPTAVIVVGHTGMADVQIKENVLSLVDQLRTKYPGGEANVRSISLKLPLSLSLPIYVTLRPSSAVIAPKLKQHRPKNFNIIEDELSTIPGRKVRVAPDGTVRVIKEKNNDNSDVEENMEEAVSEASEDEDLQSD